MEDADELVEKVLDQEDLYRNEGTVGVQNLAKFVGLLGYSDPQYFGQFQGGSYGVLINFLEDNPGAIQALQEWIGENYKDELQSILEENIPPSRR